MASTKYAEDFVNFVNSSPSPFHAVHSAKNLLEKAGFEHIEEQQSWSSVIKPGRKYILTRNASSIVAFAVGKKWRPGSPIGMIGAHTDSCCLRVKPISKKQSDGFLQVGVETYGGGLWHTWFDRDLSIAGRAIIRTKTGAFQQRLVQIKKPILRIPTLAVHLDRQESFSFNKESQLFPIAGLAAAELNRRSEDRDYEKLEKEQSDSNQNYEPLRVPSERHHPYLVELIAKEAEVSASEVVDFEMVLYDTQKACIGGLNDELIFSARLDNLEMSYCSAIGLIESLGTSLGNDSTVRLIALFDHEEIGSTSAQGAASTLLPAVIKRLCTLETSAEENASAYEETLSKSFLVSADMAHSVHPNYPGKHESDHRPEMNKGTVLKINANVRYATNSPGIVLIQEMARRAKKSSTSPSKAETGVPLQLFVGRNDTSCGSTIGPMLSAALGVRTLDLGNPQLSMHSIRETGGAHDVEHSIRLFDSFFSNFGEVGQSIQGD
ncbi:aspartyl aminopeptidase [Viridothelium virens]|uniref:aspartyl aminopeptidase n=1 Tax=Viridothelium virens TaxID=1048519 RepID=A0A6A6H854_VIRVR|nr:aspartyl aminopeptidase [Viridothelium virens]